MTLVGREACSWNHPKCCLTLQQLEYIAIRTVTDWRRVLIHLKVPYYYLDLVEADARSLQHGSAEESFQGYLKWYRMCPKKASICRLTEVLQLLDRGDVIQDFEDEYHSQAVAGSLYQPKTFIDTTDVHRCFVGREDELNDILSFATEECKSKHLIISALPGLGKTELLKQALHNISKQQPSITIVYPTIYPTELDKEKYGLENLAANIYEEMNPGVCLSKNRMATVFHMLTDICKATVLVLDVSCINMPQNQVILFWRFIERVLGCESKLKIITLCCKPPYFHVNAKQLVVKALSKEAVVTMLQFHNSIISKEDCVRIYNCCGGNPYILRKMAAHINNFTKPKEELEKLINELEINPERERLQTFILCLKNDIQIVFDQLDETEKETLIQLSHFNELVPKDVLNNIFDSSVSNIAEHLWSNHCILERSNCTRFYQMSEVMRSFIQGYCHKSIEHSQIFLNSKLKVIRYYLKILKELDDVFFNPSSLQTFQLCRKMICSYKLKCKICNPKCRCELSQIIFALFQKEKHTILMFLRKGFYLKETLIETVDTCCKTVHFLRNVLASDELQSLYTTNYDRISTCLQDDKLKLAVLIATSVFIKIYHRVKDEKDENIQSLTKVISFMESRFSQLNISMLHQLSLCYINRGYLRGFYDKQFKQGVNDIMKGRKLLKQLPKKGRFLITQFSSSGYMAAIYYQQRLTVKSIEERDIQINGYRQHLGIHPYTAKAMHYQGQAYAKVNEYVTGMNCCLVSYQMYRNLQGIGVDTMRVLSTFGKILLKAGRFRQGIVNLEKAIIDGENVLGEHDRVAWCYQQLAAAKLTLNDDPQEVERLKQKADEIKKQYRKNSNMEMNTKYVFQFSNDEIDINFLQEEDSSETDYFKYIVLIMILAVIVRVLLVDKLHCSQFL